VIATSPRRWRQQPSRRACARPRLFARGAVILCASALAFVFAVPHATAVDRLDVTSRGTSSCYAANREAATSALRALSVHTLQRPQRSPRLFVEAYAMRGLVAAHAALGSTPEGITDQYDTRDGLLRAVDYADSLVLRQTFLGYWPLGYHAQYWADMAAAVGLFPALEPYVDAERLQRYERAAEKFMKGLGRDHMLLAAGAVGVGRTIVHDPLGQNRPDYRPYLVSTALAGISVRAWLFHRTHREEYRRARIHAVEDRAGGLRR